MKNRRILVEVDLFRLARVFWRREWLLSLRSPTQWVTTICFYLTVIVLFPLGIDPARSILNLIAPAIIWIAVLLALLLANERLFEQDFHDGSLEQWMLSPHPVFLLVIIKVLVRWVFSGLPLILVAPLIAIMLYLKLEQVLILMVTLFIGTIIICLLTAFGAALTVGLDKGGMLVPLIILPLEIPVLVFAGGIGQMAFLGWATVIPHMILLCALFILAVTLLPWAIAVVLKLRVTY